MPVIFHMPSPRFVEYVAVMLGGKLPPAMGGKLPSAMVRAGQAQVAKETVTHVSSTSAAARLGVGNRDGFAAESRARSMKPRPIMEHLLESETKKRKLSSR